MDHILRQVPDNFAKSAHIDAEKYEKMYQHSIKDPDGFWRDQAKLLSWMKPFTKVQDCSFDYDDLHIKWFEDGALNVSVNCIDRHLPKRANQTALIWEPDDPEAQSRHVSYQELSTEVNKTANVLKSFGIGRGDRVVIYMPMILETAFVMLACARIGAVHSLVFGGFSAESLADRITDCGAKLVVTADKAPRGGKIIPLKANVDRALEKCNETLKVLVVERTGQGVEYMEGRDFHYADLMNTASDICPPEEMGAEDPLFILYTSGSTGRPKGVVHSTGGYLLYAAMTHQYVFDYHEGDIYWCTADVGWITGHSYVVYGPLANGATTLMFEGAPTYPDASRFWKVCEKHKVTQFYTAPTVIRTLIGFGSTYVEGCDLSSLRILGTVGEPINPEAWLWYEQVVGQGRCPIVDTWWQTETGGHMITTLPGAHETKPGAAGRPFFGILPVILDPKTGEVLKSDVAEGVLCIKHSWPGQARTVYGDHTRFKETYFQQYKGYYFSGDGCNRDKDGYHWITGRVDDVLNVSGHRMGTAEIESALDSHHAVAEAAVVGYPHDLKGQGIYCFVTLMRDVEPDERIKAELRAHVREEIGPIAAPDFIQFSPSLPRTRSGKIMRRILRKIAANDYDNLGDITTLLDSSAVQDLVDNRLNT